jgi:arylsulfatase A-like enzyme
VWNQYHDFYREKVRLHDACVGEVLGALDAAGLADRTVVMAGSDHGDMDTNHKLIFKGPFMYEHMVRVPLIVRVPAAFGGGKAAKTPYPVTHADITPTLLDFAGAGAIECHGASLRPLLTGGAAMPKRDFVVSQYYSKQQWVNPIRMIRTERYKYNQYIEHGAELYDLVNDPEELKNLAGEAKHAKAARELKGELDQWIEAHDDPFYSLKTVPLKAGRGRNKATSH